jgi:hypothetical protein
MSATAYTYQVTVTQTPENVQQYGAQPGGRVVFSQHKTEAAARRAAGTVRGYGHTDVRVETIA